MNSKILKHIEANVISNIVDYFIHLMVLSHIIMK